MYSLSATSLLHPANPRTRLSHPHALIHKLYVTFLTNPTIHAQAEQEERRKLEAIIRKMKQEQIQLRRSGPVPPIT